MKLVRTMQMLLSLICLVTMLTGNAHAAIQAVGPVNLVTSLPTWYMDSKSLPLMPCVDQNNLCLLPPPFDALTIPTAPITINGPINDANFPGEGFYYSAFASDLDPLGAATPFTIENGEVVVFGYVLEFAFLSGVVPQTGITFLRTDLQKMRNLTPNATYRLTHPYGVFEFQTDGAGVTIDAGPGIRFEDQPGTIANYLPPLFKAAPNTNMDTFLTPLSGTLVTDPLDPTKVYIGDPAIPVLVTGSQNNNNFVLIERLNASGIPVAAWQTNYFTLMGRKFTGQIPSPMSIDRVTYARDAASAQVDVFATALPAASLSISGTGLASTPLSKDISNNGKFFAHLPGTALPTGVSITNSLDVPPILYPVTLVDEIIVSKASFNPVTRNLTIKAESRDKVAPLPTLTVPQFAAPNTLDATGTLVMAIAADTIPPMTITVNSSKGGTATSLITVLFPVDTLPVAGNDTATVPAGSSTVINVVANDTSASSTLNLASILTSTPTGGTAVANSNGTVTYTAPAAAGIHTFTYTVMDNSAAPQTSNIATVTVTVSAPPAPATGVTAVASPAGTQAINTPVTITATGTGGTGQYEYRFYVNDNGTFYLIQPYSTSNTCTWLPGKAGAFDFFVEVRSAGTTVLRDSYSNIFAYVVTSPAATNVYLSADSHSPHAANSPVTFTAQGVGGIGVNEYRFWLNSGTGFVEVQPYSTVNTWTWTPTLAGNYDLFVEVRKVGSPATRDAFNEIINFQIQ